MNASWFRLYVLLAFRLDKALRAISEHSPFVDYYYGPPEWRAEVATEPQRTAPELLHEALDLAEAIAGLDLEPQRAAFLTKQVLAMQTVSQKLCGETFSLEEELQRCFDIRLPLSRTPETLFEETWAQTEAMAPGTGTLQERIEALEQRLTLPADRADSLAALFEDALAEVRHRTHTLLDLPAEETILVQAVRGQLWIANSQFQGQAHSIIKLNLDICTYLPSLLTLASHEGYPGHHTEAVLKEQHLYQEQGHLEQAIGLLIAPQAVISEGIAILAAEMLFSREETLAWLAEHLYPRAGLTVSPEEARWTSPTDNLWMLVQRNAALLLHEGHTEQEVQEYLQQYLRLPVGQVEHMLAYLQRPFREGYIFTYTAGAELMRPWLEGPDRHTVFRRWLSEPLTPSAFLSTAEKPGEEVIEHPAEQQAAP
jgi:hypothetical protein